jgi:hypothetical protein
MVNRIGGRNRILNRKPTEVPAEASIGKNAPAQESQHAPKGNPVNAESSTFEGMGGSAQTTQTGSAQEAGQALGSHLALFSLNSAAGQGGNGLSDHPGLQARINALPGPEKAAALELAGDIRGTPNEKRAFAALDSVLTRKQESPTLAERVDARTTRDLIMGVAQRRTPSARGESGILEHKHVRHALGGLEKMDAGQHARFRQTLDEAGGPPARPGADAESERALLHKALAARSEQIDGPAGPQAMGEISGFADDIRGQNRQELMRMTSPLDIDDVNTSRLNPDNVRAMNDDAVDNDGLNQRFDTSCGPTTGQILKAEADPVFALSLHKDGISSSQVDGVAGQEQQAALEAGGGTAVSQVGDQAWSHLKKSLGQMRADGSLSKAEATAFRSYAAGKREVDGGISATLEKIRARDGGHPTAQELWAMRADGTDKSRGMSGKEAFNAVAGDATHVDYDYTRVDGGRLPQHLDTLAKKLSDGEDIGLRVADGDNPGHYMMIADVRGEGDSQRFQVADPWSGKNAWVSKADLVDGSFLARDFDLAYPEITHFYADGGSAPGQS